MSVKNLINRLFGSRRVQRSPNAGPAYPPTSHRRLGPAQVRNRRFSVTRLGQRGLDPDEVHEFLGRVATELANAYAAADRGHAEATRVKNALKRWQTEQHNERQTWQRQFNHSYLLGGERDTDRVPADRPGW